MPINFYKSTTALAKLVVFFLLLLFTGLFVFLTCYYFFLGLICSVLIIGFHLIYLYFLVSYFIIINHKILE